MWELVRGAVLIAATMTTGLIAGLFYTYACSVTPGLRRTDPRAAVAAMQQINIAIQNGWFAVSFMGSLLCTVLAVLVNLGGPRSVWIPIVVALLCYVASLVITFRINIPLNNRLDAAGEPARLTDPEAVWRAFDGPWHRWNRIRAVLCAIAFGSLCWALVQYGSSTA
jgi:uncharacterized membrane protein